MAPKPGPVKSAASSAAGASTDSTVAFPSMSSVEPVDPAATPSQPSKKKKKHRGGRSKRHRRQSFAATAAVRDAEDSAAEVVPSLLDVPPETAARSTFYRLHQGNRSNNSLDSEALLDHRNSGPLQARRQSIHQSIFSPQGGPMSSRSRSHFDTGSFLGPSSTKSKLSRSHKTSDSETEDADDHTPLMLSAQRRNHTIDVGGYGSLGDYFNDDGRRTRGSSRSSRRRPGIETHHSTTSLTRDYDVNNPPSVPGSPMLGSDMNYDDVMLTGEMPRSRSPDDRRPVRPTSRDALINIDGDHGTREYTRSRSPSPKTSPQDGRRLHPAEVDVCFPQEGMSEIGQEDFIPRPGSPESRHRRRRTRLWPDLSVLEEWSKEEKEQRTMEGIRARKVSEPLLVGGRLRPQKQAWHRTDEDAPYRFTYFNEEFQSTVHSQTISELLQDGQTFRDLFIPEPPVLSDYSSDEEDEDDRASRVGGSIAPSNGHAKESRQPSRAETARQIRSAEQTGANTPAQSVTPTVRNKQPRYGPRPVFWLDVLSPTDAEMRVISKAFGIHPLTAEDIMMKEAREKVELFRHYYFVNYSSFEQDTNSEDYMEPVNMYVVVFREGIISFHFSMTPHPANVRRRIRQLSDYLILSSDWISYAIIDDITDVYAPLIQRIEDEVDDIDDAILQLYTASKPEAKPKLKTAFDDNISEKMADGDATTGDVGADMLRRVGECRKKVMSLYRLLGNKADVIKGFAKRCNEQWEVAPRSEIGLYLGDIQDHIVTMTGNLSHYENLLSRAHSNYLAQINLKMNERQEQTADVLGKLTVLGTIVLPMNIVTGMWGMNVLVPGQDVPNLYWFFGITGFLLAFGLGSYFIAKRVYGIV